MGIFFYNFKLFDYVIELFALEYFKRSNLCSLNKGTVEPCRFYLCCCRISIVMLAKQCLKEGDLTGYHLYRIEADRWHRELEDR